MLSDDEPSGLHVDDANRFARLDRLGVGRGVVAAAVDLHGAARQHQALGDSDPADQLMPRPDGVRRVVLGVAGAGRVAQQQPSADRRARQRPEP